MAQRTNRAVATADQADAAVLQGTIDGLRGRLQATEAALADFRSRLAAELASGSQGQQEAEEPVETVDPDAERTLLADDFADLGGWLNPYHGAGAYSQQGVRIRDNVEVAGGVLTVHARPVTQRVTVGDQVLEPGDYAAGGIMHQTVLSAGVRLRMELKMSASVGTRAVALLWPHQMGWPHGGELDFVENGADIGDRQSTAITNHWAGPDGLNAQRVVKFNNHDFTAWTPVEVLWLPSLFVVTIAGRVAAHYIDNVPTNPMKLAIQTAVAGGGQGTTWQDRPRTPGDMSVRRLRIVSAA